MSGCPNAHPGSLKGKMWTIGIHGESAPGEWARHTTRMKNKNKLLLFRKITSPHSPQNPGREKQKGKAKCSISEQNNI